MSDTDDDELEVTGQVSRHPKGDVVFTINGAGALFTLVIPKDANIDDVEQVVERIPELIFDLVKDHNWKVEEEEYGDG